MPSKTYLILRSAQGARLEGRTTRLPRRTEAPPPSGRFDLAGSLIIVHHLSQERGRIAPASAMLRWKALLGQQQANADPAVMSKREESKYKINRRLGVNLWGRAKSPLNRREYGPGQHGQRRKKPSDYGTQLAAKQKLKGYYGNIGERQFRRLYAEAVRRHRREPDRALGTPARCDGLSDEAGADALCRPPDRQSRACAGQRQAAQHPLLPDEGRRYDRAEAAGEGNGAGPRSNAIERA